MSATQSPDTTELIELFRKFINYDPLTGSAIWRVRDATFFKTERDAKIFNSRFAGKSVGTKVLNKQSGKTYIHFGFRYKSFYLHRVIWAMETGCFPVEIDHIDGDGCNNRWLNFRNVSPLENSKNMKAQDRDLPTGITRSRTGKFIAKIGVNRRVLRLGTFAILDDALVARKRAELLHGFHPNHGQSRPL